MQIPEQIYINPLTAANVTAQQELTLSQEKQTIINQIFSLEPSSWSPEQFPLICQDFSSVVPSYLHDKFNVDCCQS